MRVVLDTNVVISALLFEGEASRLVTGWQKGRFTLLASKLLLSEYIRVLHYPKFRLSAETIRFLVEEELLPFVSPVKVSRVRRVILADPADDYVLSCARAGKASLIVSGDRHLLSLGRHEGIPILALSEFLKRLSSLP